jgi:hypothetical protein
MNMAGTVTLCARLGGVSDSPALNKNNLEKSGNTRIVEKFG